MLLGGGGRGRFNKIDRDYLPIGLTHVQSAPAAYFKLRFLAYNFEILRSYLLLKTPFRVETVPFHLAMDAGVRSN